MNWQMITAIGQLAAVCVGIPSLIYFAIQIREQTRERRQSAVNALTVQWGDLTKALHENAEFGRRDYRQGRPAQGILDLQVG